MEAHQHYRTPESTLTERAGTRSGGSVEAALAGEISWSIGDIAGKSWQLVSGFKGVFWLAMLAYIGAAMILGGINGAINTAIGNAAVAVALEFGSSILLTPLMAGLVMLCVRRAAGAETSFGMIINYYDRILPIFVLNILVVIVVMLGMVALILPGIYLAISYAFAIPLLVDKRMGIWEAMETSRKAITHCWFRYFGLMLLSGLVIFAGALALGIGLIWTMPMAMLMFASVYHEMFGFEGDA
jgi:uncharacterized membrane protein